jgi:radical S-adenosyl methionine domain-containing protein 2
MINDIVQIQRRVLPETINIHLTRACNFGCGFCYAGFAECDSSRIPPENLRAILDAIARAERLASGRNRKVNFAGGEPLLYPGLPQIVGFSKELGLVTSMVTNGSLLDEAMLESLAGGLDICAVSLDSGAPSTNLAIGRCGRGFTPNAEFYQALAMGVRRAGIRLKINTVVNRLNLTEALGALVAELRPFRWKLFQVKEVIGQNEQTFSELAISEAEFEDFVARNRRLVPPGVAVVPETSEEMTASYAMIGPDGRFFDSVCGYYRYSRPIVEVGILEAFQDVSFDAGKFVSRGGVYE